MGFRRSGLQEALFVPGDFAFRVWGYGTCDSLEDVLRPGYFSCGGMLHLGELIYARMQAQPPARLAPQRDHQGRVGAARLRGPEPEPVHMALLMTVGTEPNGATRVRLVQDLGRTDAATAEPAAAALRLPLSSATTEGPKRKRGRPAGSRTRQARVANGHDAGPATF